MHPGETLLTTTKMGVDRLIIQYCDQHQLPLKVLKFSPPHHQPIQPTSPTIQLQQMCSPTWRRLRYVVEVSDKIRFFHARLPTKPAQEMTTVEAFERVCQQHALDGQQYILRQGREQFTIPTTFRQRYHAPIVGTVHLYVYIRRISSVDDQRWQMGHYRLETWRQFGNYLQPGLGRREVVIPQSGHFAAARRLLERALEEIPNHSQQRIMVHYAQPTFAELIRLKRFPNLLWQRETMAVVRERIGLPVSNYQGLWKHQRLDEARKGLYQ